MKPNRAPHRTEIPRGLTALLATGALAIAGCGAKKSDTSQETAATGTVPAAASTPNHHSKPAAAPSAPEAATTATPSPESTPDTSEAESLPAGYQLDGATIPKQGIDTPREVVEHEFPSHNGVTGQEAATQLDHATITYWPANESKPANPPIASPDQNLPAHELKFNGQTMQFGDNVEVTFGTH